MFLVAGEKLIDLIPLQNDLYQSSCGGSPFNVAISLGHMGANVHYSWALANHVNG